MISFIVGYVVFCLVTWCISMWVSLLVDKKLLIKDILMLFVFSVCPFINVIVLLISVWMISSKTFLSSFIEWFEGLMDKEVYKR